MTVDQYGNIKWVDAEGLAWLEDTAGRVIRLPFLDVKAESEKESAL